MNVVKLNGTSINFDAQLKLGCNSVRIAFIQFKLFNEMIYLTNLAREVKNCLKSVLLLFALSRPSRFGSLEKPHANKRCVILGNGPSLKESLHKHEEFIKKSKKGCVNDFAGNPYFKKLKPDYYILMDPIYWDRSPSKHFQQVFEQYNKTMRREVNWPMVIFMPMAAKKWHQFINLPKENSNITIAYVNTTPMYSSKRIRRFFFRANLAMPVVQNVLVASIFVCLNLGFKKIYIFGADHSWHETIFIDQDNRLCLKNNRSHDMKAADYAPFYMDAAEHVPFKMYNLFKALSRMYESYMELEDYAKSLGAKIYNASEKSYIDAFERCTSIK